MNMTPLQRTLAFLKGQTVDRPPCHPILMRWAAQYAGVSYRDFCLDPETKCRAMLKAAEDFDLDWVTVMSDPYAEAEAFGLEVEYPLDGLPVEKGGQLRDLMHVRALLPYTCDPHKRLQSRIREIRLFHEFWQNPVFVVGWVEGPVAEYCNLRGTTNASLDFFDDAEAVEHAMDVVTHAALEFIERQIRAGAHAIGIGDAFCSQIGPALYRQYAWPREKMMIDRIHSLGGLAKLHICGNTTAILPDMIRTGADIIDVDHLVEDWQSFARLLGRGQVLCGKIDPVLGLEQGRPDEIRSEAWSDHLKANRRSIISAGCEVTPGTPPANLAALRAAADTELTGR